jgi:release factor glutamine methyltransferase
MAMFDSIANPVVTGGKCACRSVQDILKSSTALLASKGLSTPRLDAEVLLAAYLGCDRLSLYTRGKTSISYEQVEHFQTWIARRAEGEPVAYIVRVKEFWSLDFYVDNNVLIPRPDTELVVEEILRLLKDSGSGNITLLDIGTGTGAIGIAIAHEYNNVSVVAIDNSLNALGIARKNAVRHGVAARFFFVCENLLEPLSGKFDIVVSNPPYISERDFDRLPWEIKGFEPVRALVAGPEGTEFHRTIIAGTRDILNSGGWLVMEMGKGQRKTIENELRNAGIYDNIQCRRDYSGIERVIMARRRSW